MKMHACTPELPVADVAEAMQALRLLGFRDAWTYEDTFACMFGDDEIEVFLRKSAQARPVTLYFKVDDADAFHALYAQHAEILSPIHDTPWGMREFEGRIVGGHVFRIGHGKADGEDRRRAASGPAAQH